MAIIGGRHRELLIYGWDQAAGQLEIIRNSKPVAEVLRDPEVPSEIKRKLTWVGDIRRYAFDTLGIDPNDNYTTFYDQKGKDLLWLVTASEAFELKAVEWQFPILGSFSYKGFFDSLKAVDEAARLRASGYDTNIRVVGGWSTLGYFSDPVLSKMLDRDEADLAELIIHELTHGTIYVRDSTQFNENLATFIGVKGAERYLASKYGSDAEIIRLYRQRKDDQQIFSEHILRGSLYLDSLYKQMPAAASSLFKQHAKETAINRIVFSIDTLELHRSGYYRRYLERIKPNNTYFMSYLRYRGYLRLLEAEYREAYDMDIKAMLMDYKHKYPSL
jgi:predicted aminopeptidase